MAIQTVNDCATLAASNATTIGPSSSNTSWIIHNIYIPRGQTVKVEYGDGTNWVHVDTIISSMLGYYFHVSYTHRLRLTNMGSSSIVYGYDGVVVT